MKPVPAGFLFGVLFGLEDEKINSQKRRTYNPEGRCAYLNSNKALNIREAQS
jgi:hypothetical protein